MVMSMTGYGRHTVESDGTTITAEVRTVNSRYLDFASKIPQSFNFLEGDIKKVIQNYFHRGRIEVYLFISGNQFGEKTIHINWDLMDQYISELKKAQQRYHLSETIPITMLKGIEGLFNVNETEKDFSHIKDPIIEVVKASCEKVYHVRHQEGLFLFKDINEKLENVEQLLISLTDNQNLMNEQYRKRIEERIKHHLYNKLTVDNDQLYQEIALLVEKGDITEEITRLSSHIEQFRLISASEGPIGRQLDFIIQEMHREVNTIGAKSVDTTIGKLVVSMKSDIDKMKEQVQNIE